MIPLPNPDFGRIESNAFSVSMVTVQLPVLGVSLISIKENSNLHPSSMNLSFTKAVCENNITFGRLFQVGR